MYEVHAFRSNRACNNYDGKGSKWANKYVMVDDLETAHRVAQDLLLTYDTVSIHDMASKPRKWDADEDGFLASLA